MAGIISQREIEKKIDKAVKEAIKQTSTEILNEIGTNKFTCNMCGKLKKKEDFYINTDPACCATGISRICKSCATNIALRVNKDGKPQPPTKESIKLALEYLDKPYFESLYHDSLQEAANTLSGRRKSSVWASYIKNIGMAQYKTMRWKDGDIFLPVSNHTEIQPDTKDINNDITECFERNRQDTIRLLGYDPFLKENSLDKPFLYANLIGYLDISENANEDRMKISSIIEIVKGFNHLEKINDLIASFINDTANIDKNIPTIKSLEATKSSISSSILNLAKDNGISLKHSVNSSKGENTWTGKVKKLKELNLREAEVNLFDAETALGIEQVANISNRAILNQIMLDENDCADMLAKQRELVTKYKKIADESEEKARILLRENIDLKETLKEIGAISNE